MKNEKLNACDTSILFKKRAEVKESHPVDTRKGFVNPDAYVLCGISRKEIPRNEIIKAIKTSVCNITEVTWEEIMVRTRKREISEARQLTHYFLKEYTKMSLSQIGLLAGNKNHATVIHSIKVINNLYDTDKTIKNLVNEIEAEIKKNIDELGSVFIQAKRVDTVGSWERVKHKYV